MLAVDLHGSTSGSTISTCLRSRGDFGPPLLMDRAHPLHILRSWPVGTARSIVSLVSEDFRRMSVSRLVDRFVEFGADPQMCSSLERLAEIRPGRKHVKKESRDLWIVLPYHPAWAGSDISSRLRRWMCYAFASLAWKKAWGLEPDCCVRVAWTISMQSTQNWIGRNAARSSRMDGWLG